MGRWRPPQPKKSPYITADGYAVLEQELKALWKRRADVTRALSAALAASGVDASKSKMGFSPRISSL